MYPFEKCLVVDVSAVHTGMPCGCSMRTTTGQVVARRRHTGERRCNTRDCGGWQLCPSDRVRTSQRQESRCSAPGCARNERCDLRACALCPRVTHEGCLTALQQAWQLQQALSLCDRCAQEAEVSDECREARCHAETLSRRCRLCQRRMCEGHTVRGKRTEVYQCMQCVVTTTHTYYSPIY